MELLTGSEYFIMKCN